MNQWEAGSKRLPEKRLPGADILLLPLFTLVQSFQLLFCRADIPDTMQIGPIIQMAPKM